jgi:RNA polymerase sigma-70 factor (ECF subfamily)
MRELKSWACRITTNACIDELRKKKNRSTLSVDAEGEAGSYLDSLQSADPTPEAALMGSERMREIVQAIERLPETQKALIILRDVNGLSYEEVAESTGIPLGTVKSALSRARLKLRNILQENN